MTVASAVAPEREAGRLRGTQAAIDMRVRSITFEAQGIHSLDLRPLNGDALAPFTAGAHVDLHLPNGITRSYSLVNPQGERHRYVVAVHRDPASRGGSRFVHESLRAGDVLRVGAPRNNFRLAEDAAHSLFIAGGIGITPLWCMIQRLAELGRSWELYYCARTRSNAAFLEPIAALGGGGSGRVHLVFDREPGGRMLDIAEVVAAASPDTHLYCCGPSPMLAAFEQATATRPAGNVHVEYFAAKKEARAGGGGFTVVLARSGRSIAVPPGRTILEALLDEGIEVQHSCMQGVCGSCETGVIEGIPDHRDMVLSDAEKASNRTVMICCAGSKTSELVLDL